MITVLAHSRISFGISAVPKLNERAHVVQVSPQIPRTTRSQTGAGSSHRPPSRRPGFLRSCHDARGMNGAMAIRSSVKTLLVDAGIAGLLSAQWVTRLLRLLGLVHA